MCRTMHSVASLIICTIQAFTRIFLTFVLMLENLFRMILQTLYNIISFLLQLISLLPICCIFLLTSRMKCFFCGRAGPCPVNRGGACDCFMSIVAIIIILLIFRATGTLDKLFFYMGYEVYTTTTTQLLRYQATTNVLTECTRNDSATEFELYNYYETTTLPIEFYYFVYYNDKNERIKVKYFTKAAIPLAGGSGIEPRRKMDEDDVPLIDEDVLRSGDKDDSQTTDDSEPLSVIYLDDIENSTDTTIKFAAALRNNTFNLSNKTAEFDLSPNTTAKKNVLRERTLNLTNIERAFNLTNIERAFNLTNIDSTSNLTVIDNILSDEDDTVLSVTSTAATIDSDYAVTTTKVFFKKIIGNENLTTIYYYFL